MKFGRARCSPTRQLVEEPRERGRQALRRGVVVARRQVQPRRAARLRQARVVSTHGAHVRAAGCLDALLHSWHAL
jgi:hypothetical protein